MGLFDKIKKGLQKTSDAVSRSLDAVFAGFVTIDDDLLEELEECIPAPAWREVEAQIEQKELSGYLEEFLDTLGKRERTIFLRRYWAAQTLKEIGKACGVTEHHAAVILERSRKKLRKFLEERGIWI